MKEPDNFPRDRTLDQRSRRLMALAAVVMDVVDLATAVSEAEVAVWASVAGQAALARRSLAPATVSTALR